MLVVHPHFHGRRTGVTAHTEVVVPALQGLCTARAMGALLPADVPRIGLQELWRTAGHETVVWHAHRNNELLAGLALKWLGRRVRLVFTRHGSNPPGAWTRWLFRRVDALVTLSDEGAQLAGHASRIVPHGVRLDRFAPPAERSQAFAALGLPGTQGLGVVGRVRPEKGQGDFVEALAPLLPTHPEWTPVLVGLTKPSEEAWAQGLAAQVGGRLHRTGELADVAPWYRGLSIVVQPSHRESFGLVLLEAMASGCCLIATRLPHVPAIVEDGVTGFLYPPGDVAALRALLARLLENPALVAQVGRAAAAAARKHWGIEHEAQALSEIYQHVVGDKPPAALPR